MSNRIATSIEFEGNGKLIKVSVWADPQNHLRVSVEEIVILDDDHQTEQVQQEKTFIIDDSFFV